MEVCNFYFFLSFVYFMLNFIVCPRPPPLKKKDKEKDARDVQFICTCKNYFRI